MQQEAPGKIFIAAPTAGNGAACRSCAHCLMAMNDWTTCAWKRPTMPRAEIHVDPDRPLRHAAAGGMVNFRR